MNTVSHLKNIFFSSLFAAAALISSVANAQMYGKPSLQAYRDSALSLVLQNKTTEAAKLITKHHFDISNNAIFSPKEKILADYLLGNFETIIKEAKNGINEDYGYLNKNTDYVQEYYLWAPDTLDDALSVHCDKKYSTINRKILDSKTLSDEEKEFLRLKFDYSLNYGRFCSFDGASFIARGNQFSEIAKDTLLANHVKELTWVPAPKSIGIGTSAYTGAMLFSGDLSNLISNSALIGANFNFNYKRFQLIADGGITIGSELEWQTEAGEQIKRNIKIPHFHGAFGFNLSTWKSISIIPFAGIFVSSIRVIEDELKMEPFSSITNKGAPTVGLIIDYNIPLKKCDNYRIVSTEHQIIFIRFRSMYSPQEYSNQSYDIKGDLLYSTVGIGIHTDYLGK